MKTLIVSAFPLETQFIKDALSELQVYEDHKLSWFKGKFYTKELLLVEIDHNMVMLEFLEQLIIQEEIDQVISVGLGTAMGTHLRSGDLIIKDQPFGSSEKMIDIFLNHEGSEDDNPLRIFVGKIYHEDVPSETNNALACLDLKELEITKFLKEKNLPTLMVRVIVPEADENNLENEIRSNVAQKLLLLLKKSIEYTS